MKNIFILFFLVVSFNCSAQPVERIQRNKVKVGKDGATKSLEFEAGLGASNPQIIVDGTNDDFELNKNTTVSGNSLFIGDSLNVNKFLEWKLDPVSFPSGMPGFRYNFATLKTQVSHDGTTWTDVNASSFTSPLTTDGAIYTRFSGVDDELVPGSEGDVLQIISGLPAYGPPPVPNLREVYMAHPGGAGCAVTLGTTADGGWNNLSSFTCTLDEKVTNNINLDIITNNSGVQGTFKAATYKICHQWHQDFQLSGSNSRVTQAYRFAVCSGSSACATTGEDYYDAPYSDYRLSTAGGNDALFGAPIRTCFYHAFASAGTYAIVIQEQTTNTSGTVGANDYGCTGAGGGVAAGCNWEIEEVF